MFCVPSLRLRLIVAFAAAMTFTGGAGAQDQRTFAIPEHDGYGVGDCLAAGPKSTCGRIVADAWCESKGFARAKSFGRGDATDVTGATPAKVAAPSQPALSVVVITCDD